MDERYLYLKFTGYPMGFFNYEQIQRQFLKLAMTTGRVALISEKLPLDKKHNKGYVADCDPYLYYDFDNAAYQRCNDINQPIPLQCIKVSDFDMNQFSKKETKIFEAKDGPAYISEEDDKQYRLIIIEHKECYWAHKCYKEPTSFFFLPYSKKVRLAAKHIINKILEGQNGQKHQLCGSLEERKLYLDYCCVHARRTDKLYKNISLTTLINIKSNLDANKNIHPNTQIYLMTDEPNDHFYDGLKEYYPNLFRYSDFPELYNLRHPANGDLPNNYLLFTIELQIRTMARIVYYSKKRSLEQTENKFNRLSSDNISLGLVEFYPLRMMWSKIIYSFTFWMNQMSLALSHRFIKLMKYFSQKP